MISGVCCQTADVRNNILVGVPGLGLVGSCRPVASRSSILKTNRCAKTVRIDCPIEGG